jgi:hypothetical protein
MAAGEGDTKPAPTASVTASTPTSCLNVQRLPQTSWRLYSMTTATSSTPIPCKNVQRLPQTSWRCYPLITASTVSIPLSCLNVQRLPQTSWRLYSRSTTASIPLLCLSFQLDPYPQPVPVTLNLVEVLPYDNGDDVYPYTVYKC